MGYERTWVELMGLVLEVELGWYREIQRDDVFRFTGGL